MIKIIKIKADIYVPDSENLLNYTFKATVVESDNIVLRKNPISHRVEDYICKKCNCTRDKILKMKFKFLDEI